MVSADVGFKAHANGRNKSQYCYMLLGVFGQQCCVRLHGHKSLTGFKLYATSANNVVVPCKRTQHVGPNNVASVCMGLKSRQTHACVYQIVSTNQKRSEWFRRILYFISLRLKWQCSKRNGPCFKGPCKRTQHVGRTCYVRLYTMLGSVA